MTYQPLENLDGQVVAITGAMGGIGHATAKRLAARGARIIGIVRQDPTQAQEKLDQLPNNALNHLAISADIRDQAQVKMAVHQIKSTVGQCNILINSIGKTKRIPHNDLDALSDDFFSAMIESNLRCYYTVIREFAPLMRQTPEGLIINIGATAAQNSGTGSNLAYASAKAGVDILTKNLSRVLAPDIRVVGVSPGALATRFVPGQSREFYTDIINRTPLQRIAKVEDIASTIEGIATLLRFITGTVIVVDGGKTA